MLTPAYKTIEHNNKKIEFLVERFYGHYTEQFYLNKSETVWNRLHHVKLNFKKIPTYRPAKKKFRKIIDIYWKKIQQSQPMEKFIQKRFR